MSTVILMILGFFLIFLGSFMFVYLLRKPIKRYVFAYFLSMGILIITGITLVIQSNIISHYIQINKIESIYKKDFPKIVGEMNYEGYGDWSFLAFYKGRIHEIYKFEEDKNYYINVNPYSLKEKEYKELKSLKEIDGNFYKKITPE